ncbi:hypothetical protein AZO1586R_1412 [Bathymodiolus azoricus thioautotrophic gill symbiont]|uniref:Uncharacterized protein n=1 Tax=Bathymodiolus azoricus thioautotrophic gill symbiont TaxID=235205 RepID=A0ACA8ZQN0_9GAMM|nr:hypothetical protein AZO1586R_1412 [Bathymodiolus azoricus thioautotrophic gill symbiont]
MCENYFLDFLDFLDFLVLFLDLGIHLYIKVYILGYICFLIFY